ncbi:MAG: delta-60 repeat domain-containing protein [Candidatus Levyibacteriota bacterium]
MARHSLGNLLRTIAACAWAAGSLWQGSALAGSDTVSSESLVLPDGRSLFVVGYEPGTDMTYGFALYRTTVDGDVDSGFGDHGYVTVPIWGYYEFADAMALQPDGRIVVGGNAADPAGMTDPQCHPALCRYYPALIRLNADGSLDRSFNGNGKLILAIGDANSGSEVAELGTLTDVTLDADGRMLVWSGSVAVARVNADGTLDKTFVGTNQVAREYASSYQGLWWGAPAGSEPGWALALTQQGDVIVADWLTYDAAGRATWLATAARKMADGSYAGNLYAFAGLPFDCTSYDCEGLSGGQKVGTAKLGFADANSGSFTYTLGGMPTTRVITREAFGALPTCALDPAADPVQATNYQGLWWGAPEGEDPGWGLYLAHQGDVVFAIWMTYDRDGSALWLSAAAPKSDSGDYSGTLYRTTGPAPGPAFNPRQVSATPVGSMRLAFGSGNSGTFTWTFGGTTRTEVITREIFGAPPTICR